jgi:UDPglucose 6-dehydrogenase
MKIGVIGTGYVGLVAGACFAESGNDVICADIDQKKIDLLNAGGVPIYEPGLEPLIENNLEAGRLTFTTDVADAVRRSDIIFIAVGTPPGEDGSADLKYVLAVARTIGQSMEDEKIVITKSTVPVGTAKLVREAIEGETAIPVHVCSNPEFLKEGAAIEDFMKPDRVVLGVDSEKPPKSSTSSTARSSGRATRSSSWTCPRPRSRSTRPTPCSPRASAS